jgi:hypothetical protein
VVILYEYVHIRVTKSHVLQIQNANWSIYGTVKADTIFYRVYWSKQNTALVIIWLRGKQVEGGGGFKKQI